MQKFPISLANLRRQSPACTGIALFIMLSVTACSPPQWASKRDAETPPETSTVTPASGKAPEGVPAPEWATGLYGKAANALFPGKGVCFGNLDGVRPANDGIGRSVFGWAWEGAAKTSVKKFILVNDLGQVVAAGDGGRVREDVPRARPDVPDPKTGWVVRIGDLVGPFDAYGVLSDGTSLCRLGRLQK